MNRNKRIRILIFLSAFAGLLLIYFLLFYSPKKRFVWAQDFKKDRDRPYGTWLMAELLRQYPRGRDFIETVTPPDISLPDAETPSNYIFIGENIYLNENYVNSILDYAKKGNNVFIFTVGLPFLLQERLYNKDAESGRNAENNTVVGNRPAAVSLTANEQYIFDTIYTEFDRRAFPEAGVYRHVYWYKYKTYKNYWQYASEQNLEVLQPDILGYFYGINSEGDTLSGVNYYRIPYGKGNFYFHTQPLLFTNLMLLDTNGLDYANTVFAPLNNGTVYWEEHNWIFNNPTSKTWTYIPNYDRKRESPLRLILSNPPLKWGWYLLLLFILLFIIFEGKRKQKPIPVLPPKENTTLEHIKTLSKLYYKSQNHYSVAQKMFDNFLWFLRTNLRIDTTMPVNRIIDQTAVKSGTGRKELEKIFDLSKKIAMGRLAGDKVFYELYKRINNFYNKLKE